MKEEERAIVLNSLQEITTNPDGLSLTPPYKPVKVFMSREVSALHSFCHMPLTSSPHFSSLQPSWFDVKDRSVKAYDLVKAYASHLNVSENAGNKPLTSNGLQRMTEFNKVWEGEKEKIWRCSSVFPSTQWLFDPELQCDTVIVVGHSLWFRSYFATFLPHDVKVGSAVQLRIKSISLELKIVPLALKPLAVAAAAKKQKMCNGGIVAFDVVQKTIQIGNAQKTVVMIAPDSVEVVHGRFKG